MRPPYTLYVSDVSYYSGKLEAFLRYREIPHRRVPVNVRILREVILPGTGCMKVPCMQCADGRWLKDTTPMLAWLDAQHAGPSIYPDDAATRFISLLVEDYADEWLWRPAMHYRWSYPDSRRLLRRRLGRELGVGLRYPARLTGWYMSIRQHLVFVHGDGVRRSNRARIEGIYHQTLAQLTALLSNTPFLLGTRPSIIDFGFFASMFRHFALDPTPARIMIDQAPAVYAWVGRMWHARAEQLATRPLGNFDSPHWNPLFAQLAQQYLPYLDANAAAYAQGHKRFDHDNDCVHYPRLPVSRYRVACREQLLDGFDALDEQARAAVKARLAGSSADRWLKQAQRIPAGLDHEFELPLAHRYPPARGWYGIKLLRGTPWDMPAGPLPDAKRGEAEN